MALLRSRNEKKGSEDVDRRLEFWLENSIYNYFFLYTCANALSKSRVLRKMIKKWVKKEQEQHSAEELISIIGDRSLESWKLKKAKNPNLQLRAFREQLIYELEWRGLNKEQIKSILIIFNNGTR